MADAPGHTRVICAALPANTQSEVARRVHRGRKVTVATGANLGIGFELCLNALTRTLVAELRGTNILVNSMCPGWVRTDMGGSAAPRSIKEGANTTVWLATLPDGGPQGGFFRDRTAVPW